MSQPAPRSPPAARRLVLAALLAVVAIAFVIVFAARPAVILSAAGHDDALFARLGRNLAEGHWLGRYNEITLIKGPGFAAFLALSNLFGLSYPLALALFHLAASALAALSVRRLLRSDAAAAALFVLLLLLSPLYHGDALRVTREVFYTSLTVALVGATIALAAVRGARRVLLVGLTGLLLGGFWLTREEGVWLLPCLLILALAPRAAPGESPPPGRARRALPFVAAAALGAMVVLACGALNWAVYGRFVVNEIKDPAFQGAMTALQEAAGPHHRDRVPVPSAARAEIYRVSPAFAELRAALDPPAGVSGWTTAGCATDPRVCGDLGGGWFMWAVRDAAARRGHHSSPEAAAAYYRRIEAEVRAGCTSGRLSCRRWGFPLVPPTTAGQADDIAASLGRSFRIATLGGPHDTTPVVSDLAAPDAADMAAFLGSPRTAAPSGARRVCIRTTGDAPDVTPGAHVSVRILSRAEVPGERAHRTCFAAACPSGACPVEMRLGAAPTVTLDLNTLAPGLRPTAAGPVHVEQADTIGDERYLKHRLADAWTRWAAGLAPAYRLLFLAGALAYVALLGRAALSRRLDAAVVVCTALAAGAAARIVLLALVDALSFPAAVMSYAMPATPLLVIFAIVALHQAIFARLSAHR